ncbi:unnamed protein product [Prunus armeniaca]
MRTRSPICPSKNDAEITQPLPRTTENTNARLSVEENEFVSERSTQVGFFNFMNGFSQMLTEVCIYKNKFYARDSRRVGGDNLGNNDFNGGFTFLLVLIAFVLLLGLAYYPTSTTSKL